MSDPPPVLDCRPPRQPAGVSRLALLPFVDAVVSLPLSMVAFVATTPPLAFAAGRPRWVDLMIVNAPAVLTITLAIVAVRRIPKAHRQRRGAGIAWVAIAIAVVDLAIVSGAWYAATR